LFVIRIEPLLTKIIKDIFKKRKIEIKKKIFTFKNIRINEVKEEFKLN